MILDYYKYSLTTFLEEFQNRPFIAIVCTILLLLGSFSLVMQRVSADQSPQTHYKSGYIDGDEIAECDFKRCHSHGYDETVPTGTTNEYNNGYSNSYQDDCSTAIGGA